jgi:hypothetical protein
LIKSRAMNNIEFYIYDDELWGMFPNGTNQRITENDKELIKNVLERIRELLSFCLRCSIAFS